MSPDTPAGSRPGSDLPVSLLAALTAFGAGATFTNILFGLPGLTRVREQALELGVLLVPTAAALAMTVILMVTHGFFRGYAVTAAGAFASVWGFGFVDEHIGGPDMTGAWLVLVAIGGGVALAGLASAGAGSKWEKVAIAIGLTAGFALNGKLAELVSTREWPPYLAALLTCALAAVAAIVARHRLSGSAERPPMGAVTLTVIAGVVVMAALLVRSRLVDDFAMVRLLANQPINGEAIAYSLLGVATLVTVLFAWYAAKLGGPGMAVLPVLGFGLAAPMTPVALGFSSVAVSGWPVVAGAIVLAAALGAFAKLSYDLPWEAFGLLAAGGGLFLISTSASADMYSEYLLMVCGGSFALAAGLVRAAGLPAGAIAAALGLATMMLTAQVLGPVTMDTLKLNLLAQASDHALLPFAVAVVALVVLFALGRAGRGTR